MCSTVNRKYYPINRVRSGLIWGSLNLKYLLGGGDTVQGIYQDGARSLCKVVLPEQVALAN